MTFNLHQGRSPEYIPAGPGVNTAIRLSEGGKALPRLKNSAGSSMFTKADLDPKRKALRMNFEYSQKVQELQKRLSAFMDEHIYPNEKTYSEQIREGDRWQPTTIIEQLKPLAKAAGLWNLFLPDSEYGAGLTNLEYAPLCELMGRSPMAPEVFNCSAPDTGNMETIERYGSQEQKERW